MIRTFFLLFILILCKDDAVEIASDEVSEDDADIDCQDVKCICHPEIDRHAQVVEGISDAVGEAADNEERNSEKKGQILLLTRELYGCGHNESATDTEKAATDGSGTESELKDLLSGFLNGHWSDTGQKRCYETAEDISQQNQEEGSDFVLPYESGCTGVKAQLIAYHC